MNNNINWVGNKVLDQGSVRQTARPYNTTTPTPQNTPSPQPITQGGFNIPETLQGPPPSTEKGYIPYYLASNIGRKVRAEFIIGTSQFTDKTGELAEVGINYFVLYDVNSRTYIMCDMYSVRFVTILQE